MAGKKPYVGPQLKTGYQERLLLSRVLDKSDLGDTKSRCKKCKVLDWILVFLCANQKRAGRIYNELITVLISECFSLFSNVPSCTYTVW